MHQRQTKRLAYRGTNHLHIPVSPLPVKLLLMCVSDIRMIYASFDSITTPLLNAFSYTFSILVPMGNSLPSAVIAPHSPSW